jgi:hypothetical protein
MKIFVLLSSFIHMSDKIFKSVIANSINSNFSFSNTALFFFALNEEKNVSVLHI